MTVEKVSTIIEPSLSAMGYNLVLVRLLDASGKRTLQVMAERQDDANMSVEDCEKISHTVSALLDVEDPIDGTYNLEISSPGIDRPLVRKEDYAKFAGQVIKLETKLAIEKRRRFTGKIVKAGDKDVELECSDGTVMVPYDNIHFAKLMLTDELIREHLRQHKKATKH